MYIKGIGHVSALGNGNGLPNDVPVRKALEPDYTQYIDPRQLRRMARIIQMSVAAAQMALKDADITQLDAIVTGTGLGCIEDTQEFLRDITAGNETLPSPTAFIKSTHNTIGGQIALLGNHNCYNMTYAHHAFSFESALLDGMLLLAEDAENVLVGGIDELTDVSAKLLQRLGCIQGTENPAAPKGGEGAVFLALGNEAGANDYAKVEKVSVCHHDNPVEALKTFLQGKEVDLVLTGANNRQEFEREYKAPLQTVLPQAAMGYYKHLCGEYHTASAVGTLLAVQMLKDNRMPADILLEGIVHNSLKNILLYHCFGANGHAFILLSE